MPTEFTIHMIRDALKDAHAAQREKTIVPPLPPLKTGGGYNVFVFFNMESVEGLGHCIMGYGPVDGAIDTMSFYRHSKKVVAPAEIATLRKPEPFSSILDASGWITHGNDGRIWNEHMTCCLAIECGKEAYEGVSAFVERTKAHPGTYNLLTRNCVHVVLEAMAAGGMSFDTKDGRRLNPVIPRTVFDDVSDVKGGSKFGEWAYWFEPTPPPENGFPTRALTVDDPSL